MHRSQSSTIRGSLTLALAMAASVACERATPTQGDAPAIDGPRFTAAAGLTATAPVRGTLGSLEYETEHGDFSAELKTKGAADVVTVTVMGGPGSHSGWHYHPGPAIVIVRRGTVTSFVWENGTCRRTSYPAGTALIEGTAPHILRNEGSDDIELSVVFLAPQGAAQRIDAPAPGGC